MAINSPKRPTLKTIANLAGLGVTTVSKALKDAPDIAQATKDRVKEIAEQVGYQPDHAALRLRTGKSNTISLIMHTDLAAAVGTSMFIIGITKALESTPYSLVVTPYNSDDDPLKPIRHVFETQLADGVILTRIEPEDQRLLYLDKIGLPVATYGRSSMIVQHAFYDFDCRAFGRDAVHTLARLQCKRIAMIYPSMDFTYSQLMQDGYRQGVDETGVEEHSIESISINDPIEIVADHICTLLKRKTRPDGFVCAGAQAAMGVMAGVERAGLTIGKDVQIIAKQSFANVLKWFGKPIYYIGEDNILAGHEVTKCLLGVLGGDSISDHQKVAYTDVVGQSVLE